MSQAPLFRLVFEGKLTEEYDQKTARQRFRSLFGMNQENVDKIFNSGTVVVHEGLTEDDATSLALRLIDAGCECYIEEMLADDQGEAEDSDRRLGERRTKFRRSPRYDALTPERRLSFDRRRNSKFRLLQGGGGNAD